MTPTQTTEPRSTRELLAEYTARINTYGAASQEATELIERHKGNIEFVQLAQTAKWLKGALTAPSPEDSLHDVDLPSHCDK